MEATLVEDEQAAFDESKRRRLGNYLLFLSIHSSNCFPSHREFFHCDSKRKYSRFELSSAAVQLFNYDLQRGEGGWASLISEA